MALTISWERGHRRPGKTRTFFAKAATIVATNAAAMIKPHKVALKNLANMPLSVLGLSGVDFAAFHVAHGWGWLVTGISLLVLERMIADDDQ